MTNPIASTAPPMTKTMFVVVMAAKIASAIQTAADTKAAVDVIVFFIMLIPALLWTLRASRP
jgi:hypothetical protein